MNYEGKLYGHIGGRKYFDTGKTGKDWDNLEISRNKLDIDVAAFNVQIEARDEEIYQLKERNKKLAHLLNLSEGTCETCEELGQQQHEKIKKLLFALRELADYYLYEKELDTEDHIDMTNRVEIVLKENENFD